MSSSRVNAIIPVVGVGTALWAFLTIGSALIRRSFPIESQRWYQLLGTGAPPADWLFLPVAIALVAGSLGMDSIAARKLNRSDIAVPILVPALLVASSQLVLMMEASARGLTTLAMIRAGLLFVGYAGASVLVTRAVSAHG